MAHEKNQHTAPSHDHADAWHSHAPGELAPDARAEKVDVLQVLLFSVFGFLIIVVAVTATIVYFNWYTAKAQIARAEAPDLHDPNWKPQDKIDAAYTAYRTAAETEQSGYGWTDPENNKVRIPLKEAKARLAEKIAATK
jgi:hypothetical protein